MAGSAQRTARGEATHQSEAATSAGAATTGVYILRCP